MSIPTIQFDAWSSTMVQSDKSESSCEQVCNWCVSLFRTRLRRASTVAQELPPVVKQQGRMDSLQDSSLDPCTTTSLERRGSQYLKKLEIRVLIVDDNPVVIKLFERLFTSHIYARCTRAENGNKALEEMLQSMVANDPFDVIVMDHDMPPGPTGTEIARTIRKRVDLPLHIFSYSMHEDLAKEIPDLHEIYNGSIAKPVTPPKFREFAEMHFPSLLKPQETAQPRNPLVMQ